MPVYSYRREDGTLFDVRQSFSDEPLTVDPNTGQKVVRVVHNAGVIFKGSGFYVNDSKSASKQSLNGKQSGESVTKSETAKGEAATSTATETTATPASSTPTSAAAD